MTPELNDIIDKAVAKWSHELPGEGSVVRNNGASNPKVHIWYNSTEHDAVEVKRLASAAKTLKPVEKEDTIDSGLATKYNEPRSTDIKSHQC
jgi:hypothetical protein